MDVEAKPKYKLTWSGEKDSKMLRAAIEHLKVFPLFKDSKAELISYEEYKELVKVGEISKPESYWQIKEGQVGLVSLEYYRTYSETWSLISSALGDFVEGWRACEKAK